MDRGNIRNRITLFVLLIICFINHGIHTVSAQESRQQVLLLNSYHSNFTWTSEMVESILTELKKSELNPRVYMEYMDWKNFPTKQNIDNLYTVYKTKYKNNKFDLIITTDDKALEFVLEHRQELFPNAPIVFAGINKEGEQILIKDGKNVTGVIERIDLEETITMAMQINPNMEKLYIIHDQTESGKSSYNIAEEIIKSSENNIKPISMTKRTHGAVIEDVKALDKNSAILITSYYQDALGQPMEFEEFCEKISQISQVPVFHMYALTMRHGNIGGAMVSSKEQGAAAGQIGIRILNGEKADEIPVVRDFPMKIAFDYNQLKRFDIRPKLILKEVEIINEPFSFYKTYKKIVIISLTTLAVLIILIIILILYIKEIKKIRSKLQTSNKEISDAYEELTASDEELQQQLEEITSIQSKLREMAYLDPLTQMPNKRALEEDFHSYIYNCNGKMGAVIFIDADNFKLINDTLGHSMGDEFIIQIGNRLQKLGSDSIKIYRMGGDEFLLLITHIKNKHEVEKIADDIMQSFRDGFLIEEILIHTTVSAGIAIYPDHGETSETLIMGADIAMYKAKEKGKDRYVFYNNEMNEEMIERAAIEKNLRQAIQNEELPLNYQPQYDLKTKEIIGFEALLRWNSEELGWISPFKFIKIAEDSRTIIPIGKWVLETACEFLKKIHMLGYKDYTMAVNISSVQVMQEDFVEMVLGTLKENNIEAKHLEIEMTETMLIENFKMVVAKLEKLRGYGIKVALDDFGTGYSSLSYLNSLPIDTLKIDKSFVDMISVGGEGRMIINILITLGHGMGIKVVAEGVETEEEFDYLREYECDTMQGYLLSKPLSEEEVSVLLATDKTYKTVKG